MQLSYITTAQKSPLHAELENYLSCSAYSATIHFSFTNYVLHCMYKVYRFTRHLYWGQRMSGPPHGLPSILEVNKYLDCSSCPLSFTMYREIMSFDCRHYCTDHCSQCTDEHLTCLQCKRHLLGCTTLRCARARLKSVVQLCHNTHFQLPHIVIKNSSQADQ